MATIKSEYYRFNGAGWDLHYFKTSADLIVETTSYKVMTAEERTAISTYLATFNAANKLAQVEAGGKLPVSIIPGLSYLPLAGGTLTGALYGTAATFTGQVVVGGSLFINGGVSSDNSVINFTGLDALDFDGAVLRNISDPYLATDAVNKQYVDGLVAAGMRPIAAVKTATTGNVAALSGLGTYDGYTLVAGDRILVWKQTTPSQNGIYVAASGAWAKVDADSTQGAYVFVENGTLYNDWYFFCTNNTGTWIDQGRPDTIKAGTGLTKTGTTLSIENAAITNAMLAGAIASSKLANFASWEQDEWVDIEAANASKTLPGHFGDIYSLLRIIRGTTNYNTQNTQTIAGAYALANTKSKNEVGTSVPSATVGYNTGDTYLRTLA